MSPEIVSHVVRLYTLKNKGVKLAIDTEFEAFAFTNYREATLFANRLPTMSAIEILIIMDNNIRADSSQWIH